MRASAHGPTNLHIILLTLDSAYCVDGSWTGSSSSEQNGLVRESVTGWASCTAALYSIMNPDNCLRRTWNHRLLKVNNMKSRCLTFAWSLIPAYIPVTHRYEGVYNPACWEPPCLDSSRYLWYRRVQGPGPQRRLVALCGSVLAT